MSVLPPNAKPGKRWLAAVLAALAIILVVSAIYFAWENFFHEYPQQVAGDAEQFKYGSIGVEEQQGIPYWIWVVLPRVFPEHLPGPGGYTSLGIVWEPGAEMPVGFSKRHIGYDRVAFNCALCHSTTYRTRRADGRLEHTQVVPAGPAARFDAQGYLAFLSACAADPRFNADTLMPSIEYNVKLSLSARLLYRHVFIPATRKALREQTTANTWMESRPLWGHGRIDPFNPVKFGLLQLPVDDTVGNSDMMPLWQLARRRAGNGSFHMHWDGLVTRPIDASLSGALGDGATKKSLPVAQIEKMTAWLSSDATAPPGFPQVADSEKVVQGQSVFNWFCAKCHSPEGELQNLPHPLDSLPSEQRTDSHRLTMWNTVQLPDPLNPQDDRHPATRYRRYADGYAWDLNSFVGTTGYVATPLNGLWLRGPYLHNGSVPTLADLLNEPLSPIELRDLLAGDPAAAAGALEQLLATLQRAQPPGLPAEELSRTLDSLKPVVDRLIDSARRLDRRPPVFYRGSDVVDPERLGFDCTSAATVGRRFAIPYVTLIPGNGNQGHEYGTDLSPEQKLALIEYLKTYRLP
jgi:hypothetical protein